MRPITSPTFRPRPRRIYNPLTLLLLWASKTDPKLVVVCSRWAQSTQAAFGLLVLITTALAFCSAYYTLSTLGVADRWLPWITAAYTIFIFTIDREIVGSLDRTTAFIRPILALFIGMVVAVPVELWIFQDRVDQELAKDSARTIRSSSTNYAAPRASWRSAEAIYRPPLPSSGSRRPTGATSWTTKAGRQAATTAGQASAAPVPPLKTPARNK